MSNDEKNKLKDIEIFMLAQFIDVLDALNKFECMSDLKQDLKSRRKIYMEYINKISNTKSFLSLNLYNEYIDRQIERCKEIYSTSNQYKKTLKKCKEEYEDLLQTLEAKDIEKLDRVKEGIYELCSFDVHLAYKIGLINGIKIKDT